MIRRLNSWLSAAVLLATSFTVNAHIGYTGRDFGTLDPAGTTTNSINGQNVSTKFGWADGTDADWGDSHRLRPYRFTIANASYVTITFTGVTGGTGTGLLKPGFSIYRGLAHTTGAADHDFAVISQSWLATQFGSREACFNALGDWRMGSDDGLTFADLSSFTFVGYAVDGTSANFGSTPGIVGDGTADNTVTGTFYLTPGDYTLMVGGADYNEQPTPSSVYLDPAAPSDTTRRSYTDTYKVNGTVSVSAASPSSLVSFSSANVTAAMGSTNAYVTLTRPVGGPAFSVGLTATNGTAIAGTHFTAPTAAVAFAANETSRTVAIPLVAQSGIVPDRSFSLSLGTPTNSVGVGAQISTAVTILGNDTGGVLSFASTAVTAIQGDTSVNITVNRTASLVASTVALTTTNGSAVAGTDFTAPTATVDFAANETSKTVAITLIPRAGVQPNRTFSVGIGATTGNATVGAPSSLTVTINSATSSAPAATVTNGDPGGAGITYAWMIEAGANNIGTLQDHCGAWSWEDNSLFTPPDPAVGWTHTSRWVALRLTQPVVVTVTLARDRSVPYASGPGGFADSTSMFPSFTLWKNWHDSDSDFHTYNNKGAVDWAPGLEYLDHVDNSTAESVTRSWYLPAGDYTMALGSNAPATNPNRQGFSFTIVTSQTAPADLKPNIAGPPAEGGIGYGYTVIAKAGASGSFKDHVGAWSWEDNALFSPGQPSVGWTHTSKWVQVKLLQDSLFTVSMNRDATVRWVSPNNPDPNQMADTSSMFPSFTLYRGADQDGADNHTYNNKGAVSWAEDLVYVGHVDNSTDSSVARTFRLPAGDYTLALGSNAPATNTLRQGFSFNWSAQAVARVTQIAQSSSGVPYTYTLIVGAGDSGSIKDHVGAWSWEDNALFGPGDDPVGWTHTSKWVAVMLKDAVTLNVTMARDATVPWPSQADPNRLADTSSMFPSLTIWRGWDQDGMQDHTYNNHGNVAWAEDIHYIDHLDNSTANSITRSWTLPAGLYTFVLGSNAPATNSLRQGFSFSYSTSAPVFVSPVITKQPVSLSVNVGQKAAFSVTATGPSLGYQWFKNGVKIDGATSSTFNSITAATLADAGSYKVEVRNPAGAVMSNPAILGVVAIPVMNPVTLPDVTIGQVINTSVSATNNPASFVMTGRLPAGVTFNATTGAITGRALAAGDFAVSFKATNRAGTSALAQGDTITVAKLFGDGVVRSFTGVLGRSSTMNNFLGGSIKINTTAVGGFTGTLVLGTKSYPVSGLLNTSLAKPTGTQTIARVGQGPLVVSFTIDPTNKQATGTVVDGPWNLDFIARQPASALDSFKGNYTLALKLDTPDQGDATKPQGYGYGGFTVAPTGVTSGVIILSDETKVTFSAPLEHMGNLGLFKLLYANLGSVIAVLHIDTAAGNALDDSTVDWFKTGTTTGADRAYKAGFGPLALVTVGRLYSIPATAATLSSWLTAGTNNAKLTFAEGGAPSPSTRLNTSKVTIVAGSPKAATINPSFNPGKATLSLTPGAGSIFTAGITGSFKGTFKLTDTDTSVTPNKSLDRSVTFNGMIVNDGTSTKGYGCFLLPEMPVVGPPKTTILTSKKLSGSVLLEAQTPAP